MIGFETEDDEVEDEVIDKSYVLGVIGDTISNFLYYDRKEDDNLPVGKIDEMVAAGELTIDDMVNAFRSELVEGLK